MANPYLTALNAKHASMRDSLEGLQTRAVAEKRDLDANELELVRKQGEAMALLSTEIEMLTEIEKRNAAVAAFGAEIEAARNAATSSNAPGAAGAAGAANAPTPLGGATTEARDPGHYTRNGKNSFFGDLTRAGRDNDGEAIKRLAEHNVYQTRADGLTTGSNGPGIVAPKWLTDEFAEIARQGRALANAVRNIPLGDDPRPITLPKQTAGTDAVVLEQAAENDEVADTDLWDSATDTITPKPTSGIQIVSRQMLDMSTPAVDSLIYSDLISAYNFKVEKKVALAITVAGTSGGGVALDALGDEGAPVTDPDHYNRVAFRAATAVWQARKLPATIFAMSIGRYGLLADLRDTTGRPLMPEESAGPANVVGVGKVDAAGRFRTLPVFATEGMLLDTQFAAVRASDVLLFEGNLLRFRYEQPLGPQSIKLGIWSYTAAFVRYGNASVKLVNVTGDES